MKQNVIALSNYRAAEPFDYSSWNRRAERRFRSAQLRFWISTIVDTAATLAITGCTVFCCYLALTMI